MSTREGDVERIEPCAVCGGAPEFTEAMGESWVRCPRCRYGVDMEARASQAVAAWNRLVTHSTFKSAASLTQTGEEKGGTA